MWRLGMLVRETGFFVVLAVGLVAAAVFAFFWLPPMVVSPNDLQQAVPVAAGSEAPRAPTAADLVQARNGVRTAGVALIAGVGVALATGFAARTYYLTRRTQIDDRYGSAIKQLKASDEAVKVSAVRELDEIARRSPARHSKVMAVLASFVRDHQRPAGVDRPPSGVQEACAVLARRRWRRDGDLQIKLADADLRGIEMDGAPLRKADLRGAHLEGAWLRRSDLREANLANAYCTSTRFDDAKLKKATLAGATLPGATLDKANAQRANLKDVQLDDTFMRGTDLRHTTGLARNGNAIEGAIIDTRTKLPPAG